MTVSVPPRSPLHLSRLRSIASPSGLISSSLLSPCSCPFVLLSCFHCTLPLLPSIQYVIIEAIFNTVFIMLYLYKTIHWHLFADKDFLNWKSVIYDREKCILQVMAQYLSYISIFPRAEVNVAMCHISFLFHILFHSLQSCPAHQHANSLQLPKIQSHRRQSSKQYSNVFQCLQ